MFKLGVVLIFVISVTFGYNTDTNSEFTWHDVKDIEDLKETPDPRYTSINSKYERHYLVHGGYYYQETSGKFVTGK
jgi:hypothetical protein